MHQNSFILLGTIEAQNCLADDRARLFACLPHRNHILRISTCDHGNFSYGGDPDSTKGRGGETATCSAF